MSLAGFSSVGVIGAGQMGAGIAQVIATAGAKVELVDIQAAMLEKAKLGIEKSLSKLATRETITTEEKNRALENLRYSSQLEVMKNCDLIIEAIVENESVKTSLWQKLDALVKPEAIFATNTSSIPITRLAASTKRANKFIGMHFMNPVPIMKLVEIIPGLATSQETQSQILALVEAIGKKSVVSRDFPGFIVNRILMPMINEAFRALQDGVASPVDIDNGMKLGTNQPMGPLALADFIGLDTCLAILHVLYEGLGDTRYAPCALLKQYVDAGYLGVKAKRGVYSY